MYSLNLLIDLQAHAHAPEEVVLVRKSRVILPLPLFQNAANSGFEMCLFLLSELGTHLRSWEQNTSRIQNKEIYTTFALPANTMRRKFLYSGFHTPRL